MKSEIELRKLANGMRVVLLPPNGLSRVTVLAPVAIGDTQIQTPELAL